MSVNVYRAKQPGKYEKNPKMLPVDVRMNHEVLIDLFRDICRQYSIKHTLIAKHLVLRKTFVASVLNKRQYVSTETFIDMCEMLKVMINVKARNRARQLTIPL